MKSTFMYSLQEKELLEALELAIIRSQHTLYAGFTYDVGRSQIIPGLRPSVTSPDGNSNLPWAKDLRFSTGQNIEVGRSASVCASNIKNASSTFSVFITACTLDPSAPKDQNTSPPAAVILAEEILARVRAFLRIDESKQVSMKANLDTLSLEDLGADSLIAIELRNWWRQKLRVDVTVLQVLDCNKVSMLGELAVDSLKTHLLGAL
jgi:acyl carrier protein